MTQKQLHLRNQLHHHDHLFVKRLLPYFKILEKYFRYEVIGLEKIPKKKCLVVMNHGVIPFAGFLLTKHLIEKRGIYPRGLAAGFVFDIPLVRDFFLKGGAVNANHYNSHALLKENNVVMLAPGGMYEGLICRPGMKRIPWERRTGFVKLAIETNTPIIPTFCQGLNEVYDNSKFLLKWRIKFLEATRFSMPFFWGLGLLPFSKKLIHFIGDPIYITRKKRESQKAQIKRIHHQVLDAMKKLAA